MRSSVRTVFCTGFNGPSVGGSAWHPDKACAELRYKEMSKARSYDTDTIEMFALKVPVGATQSEVTRLVDDAFYHGSDDRRVLRHRPPKGKRK